MVATLTDLAQNVDIPKKGTVVAAPTALTDLTALLNGHPARRLIVGTISGTLILTQEDSTTLTVSEAVLLRLNGVLDHVCTHIQSAACEDILAQR
jgi:hypothetical protein